MKTPLPKQAGTPAARQARGLRYGVAPASRGPSAQASLPAHSFLQWTAAVCPKHQPQHVRVLRGLLNFHALRLAPLTRNTAAVLKTHFPLPAYA